MLRFTFQLGAKPEAVQDIAPDASPSGEGDFLVYIHRDVKGNVFYVGEGVGRRPWSTDRHPLWHHYVLTRSEGRWSAQIVSRHATKEDAVSAEDRWIAHYAGRIVNWFGRESDYKLDLLWLENRNASRSVAQDAKTLASTDPAKAFCLFAQAMEMMYSNSKIDGEVGLLRELMSELYYKDDPYIFEWYTVALMKAKRFAECIAVSQRYAEMFPPRNEPARSKLMKRAERAQVLLLRG